MSLCAECNSIICRRCVSDACPETLLKQTGYHVSRMQDGHWHYCHQKWLPDCGDGRIGDAESIADAKHQIELAEASETG